MMTIPRSAVFVMIVVGLTGLTARGQAVPAGSPDVSFGFQVPTVGGTLNYSVSVSESISKGFYSDSQVGASTNISGNLGLITASERHPFSAIYSGGYLFSNANQPSVFFQNLAFSQVLTAGHWNLVLSDAVNYLPQTASTGLSGVAGLGDVANSPVQVGDGTGQGILTNYGPRVSNTVSGTVSHPISPNLSFQGSGLSTTLRYLGASNTTDSSSQGLDSTLEEGSGGVTYRIGALQSAGANYSYTHFSFSNGPTLNTQGVSGFYNRRWTRRLSTNVSAGPLLSSSSFGGGTTVNFSASAGVTYVSKRSTSGINYNHGVNSGSGVIAGAIYDNVTGSFQESLGRVWSVSGSLGYARTKSVPSLTTGIPFRSNGVIAAGQVSRALGRRFSTFGSYTLQHQSLENTTPAANAFGGLYQTFSFGLTFSPRSISLGRL